jgi:hypothetical protein
MPPNALNQLSLTDGPQSRILNNNYQFELFGFIMNRDVLDGQALANAHMFSSSKTTAKILEKHIWHNTELRKKLQLDLVSVVNISPFLSTLIVKFW